MKGIRALARSFRSDDEEERVTVAVRIKPWIMHGAEDAVKVLTRTGRNEVTLKRSIGGQPAASNFAFDHVFDTEGQRDIYDSLGPRLLSQVLNGYNSSVFAYGQTGSGKTFTMLGGAEQAAGLIPRLCQGLFSEPALAGWTVHLAFFEIYNEQVVDLLSQTDESSQTMAQWRAAGLDPKRRAPLRVREHATLGVYIEGLTKRPVTSPADVEQALREGSAIRAVAGTAMNEHSSRSHAVVQLLLDEGTQGDRMAQLNLIDLAGSENVARSKSEGMRLVEAKNINVSLLALSKCISLLASTSATPRQARGVVPFIPYRESSLTWILKDSLGGNAHTLMFCMVDPHASNAEQSLTTLRYAEQAKKIRTKPVVNEDATKKMVRELQAQVALLQAQAQAAAAAADAQAPQTPSRAPQLTEDELGLGVLLDAAAMARMSREEKLNLALKLKAQRSALFVELGIDDKPPPLPSHVPMPYLVSLAEPVGGIITEPLKYCFRAGLTWIGCELPQGARLAPMEDEVVPSAVARVPSSRMLLKNQAAWTEPARYLVLTLPGILPKHARVVRTRSSTSPTGGECTIYAQPGAAVFVNGVAVSVRGDTLTDGDYVVFGSRHAFVYRQPMSALPSSRASTEDAPDDAQEERTLPRALRQLETVGSSAYRSLRMREQLREYLFGGDGERWELVLPSASALFTPPPAQVAPQPDGSEEGSGDDGAASSVSNTVARATHFFTFVLPRLAILLTAALLLNLLCALPSSEHLFEIVMAVEMVSLGTLLLCGLLGVGEVVSTIPTLTSPIALVLLESLLGAYSATWADARAVRQPTVDGAVALLSNAHLGKLLGAALFVIALMHALLSALPTRFPHCVRFLASAYDSHLVKPAASSML